MLVKIYTPKIASNTTRRIANKNALSIINKVVSSIKSYANGV
jgi:hypothetical protein